MSEKLDLLRSVVVRSEPGAIYVANFPCVVELWAADKRLGGEDNGIMRISKSLEEGAFWRGSVLPFNMVLRVFLKPRELLVAACHTEGDLNYSVIPQ